ncbi:protein FAR1-RELATED SEQUENCE 5-like [Chenopodium quinoa]|uniref:protein FAR1-RELATED SEQUENCE 5-like n=1 Tax=Chenopodium quinoa TaxID=63459 RepID=UPI000B794757|nr:protein FAR1-RELATED SEQUENCE 5-like [Chenopodium quinoa]
MTNSASGDCVDFDRDCERVFPSGVRLVDSLLQQMEKKDDIVYLEAEKSELKDKNLNLKMKLLKRIMNMLLGKVLEFELGRFHIDHLGVYTCTRHEMVHNHAMIPPEKRHLIRSQRDVNKEQLLFISTMKLSGVKVTATQIEECDSNQLIKYFAKRHVDEADFYYDFEQDDSGALVSFFWRDGRMMRDYHYFGDLLVFYTTYRTNKYGMICAPFVGMNHHGNNVMFGMCFILNERTEAFDWLFDTFLHSMGRKSPIAIMTDQAQAIAAGIRNIFPSTVHHRLCVWHLEQNSKKHIGALRALEGFTDLFGYLLKYCETPAEFEYFWKRMCDKYKCENDDWLCDLYKIKEMWCPAYSKKYWSGGILSSQRSETTNN